MLAKLQTRFGQGGMLHYGQGKWYPGEPLPRWALGLFWRKDGVPVWRGVGKAEDRKAKPDDAKLLAERLAARLGLDPAHILPAREDPIHWIKAESDLPPKADLAAVDIDDAQARGGLAKAMAGGLSKPKGYVLPMRRAMTKAEGKGWVSEAWRFRRGGLFLLPGDSPIGLRLPLGALPEVAEKDYPFLVPVDPYEERGALAGAGGVAE